MDKGRNLINAEGQPTPEHSQPRAERLRDVAGALGPYQGEIAHAQAELIVAENIPGWQLEEDHEGPKLVREVAPMMDHWHCPLTEVLYPCMRGPMGPLAQKLCVDQDHTRTLIEVRPDGVSFTTGNLAAVHLMEARLLELEYVSD